MCFVVYVSVVWNRYKFCFDCFYRMQFQGFFMRRLLVMVFVGVIMFVLGLILIVFGLDDIENENERVV